MSRKRKKKGDVAHDGYRDLSPLVPPACRFHSQRGRKHNSSLSLSPALFFQKTNFHFPLTVIEVKMSDDIRHAYVYISTHETLEEKEILKNLKNSSHYIAKEMNKLVSMKFLPRLIFRFDETSKNSYLRLFKSIIMFDIFKLLNFTLLKYL